MIPATQALIDLLNTSDTFLMADLFTFVTQGGQTLRYTSADIDLAIDGYSYLAFCLERGNIRQVAGIQVDTLSVTFFPSDTDYLGNVPFLHGVSKGMLDGAEFTLHRAFFSPDWQTYVGKILRFSGRVSDIEDFTRSAVPITIKSDLEILNTKMPRNIYQPSCRRTLFDSGCGVSKAAFAANSTVTAGSTATQINCGLAQAAGWFTMGSVTFTSGANSGVSRTVKSYGPGVLVFSLPLPYLPAVGDTFTAYAGCDRLKTTCEAKFNNLLRFSGEPYIPAAETAY